MVGGSSPGAPAGRTKKTARAHSPAERCGAMVPPASRRGPLPRWVRPFHRPGQPGGKNPPEQAVPPTAPDAVHLSWDPSPRRVKENPEVGAWQWQGGETARLLVLALPPV